jgi:hypothetical protein
MLHQRKLIATLLILPLFAFIKADWFTQSLDNSKVSINFPLKPERMVQANGTVVWKYVNDVSICMVTVIDLNVMGMDSAAVKTMLADPGSLQEFRDGLIGQLKGSKLIAEAKAELSGFPSYDFTVDVSASSAEGDKDIMYTKSVFIGARLYGLYFHEKKGKLQEAERKQFFSSFKVVK